jgi:hypothetical protein
MKRATKILIGFTIIASLTFGIFGIIQIVVPDKPNMPVASQLSDVDDP